jgi:hypothetical protein
MATVDMAVYLWPDRRVGFGNCVVGKPPDVGARILAHVTWLDGFVPGTGDLYTLTLGRGISFACELLTLRRPEKSNEDWEMAVFRRVDAPE